MKRARERTGCRSVVLVAASALALGACASSEPTWRPTALPERVAVVEAPVVAPERVDTAQEPWDFGSAAGRIITTPNYRIYTTLSSSRVLGRIPLFLERALVHYRTALAAEDMPLPEPAEPMITYLFRTRGEWLAKTRDLLPHQADAFEGLGRGGYTTRGTSVLYYIGYRDTMAIAAHEGWHQYTQRTFRDPLPVWLEEGIATWMEGHRGADTLAEFLPWRNWERWSALREAVRRDRLIPLEELLERTPQSFLLESKDALLTYYAQVWCLTRFLADGAGGRYADALHAVLVDAANGDLRRNVARAPRVLSRGGRRASQAGFTGPWVVIAYFNPDLEEFEREFLEYARELVSGRLYSSG